MDSVLFIADHRLSTKHRNGSQARTVVLKVRSQVFLCFLVSTLDYIYYIGYIYSEEGEDMYSNIKQKYFFCLDNKDFKKEFKSGIKFTIKC